jgi:hypothetical protein
MLKMNKYGEAVSVRPHVPLQKPVNEFKPNLTCHILHYKLASEFIGSNMNPIFHWAETERYQVSYNWFLTTV